MMNTPSDVSCFNHFTPKNIHAENVDFACASSSMPPLQNESHQTLGTLVCYRRCDFNQYQFLLAPRNISALQQSPHHDSINTSESHLLCSTDTKVDLRTITCYFDFIKGSLSVFITAPLNKQRRGLCTNCI